MVEMNYTEVVGNKPLGMFCMFFAECIVIQPYNTNKVHFC